MNHLLRLVGIDRALYLIRLMNPSSRVRKPGEIGLYVHVGQDRVLS